ncbi:MAG: hypothetical protein A3F67_06760 [Verrucomicrobia bacterium RIFCSPHIGHO2_12_FULL_41_10]|nr:MAG: hypothetical protein A3F67_06760 [Verrucomicrobia bacterium RIFCSPHIGHO2_12_FULL_41_10]HLB33274.1 hypothetical protein [Chthoniobacterales bacterium]
MKSTFCSISSLILFLTLMPSSLWAMDPQTTEKVFEEVVEGIETLAIAAKSDAIVQIPSQQTLNEISSSSIPVSRLNLTTSAGEQSDHFIQSSPSYEVNSERFQMIKEYDIKGTLTWNMPLSIYDHSNFLRRKKLASYQAIETAQTHLSTILDNWTREAGVSRIIERRVSGTNIVKKETEQTPGKNFLYRLTGYYQQAERTYKPLMESSLMELFKAEVAYEEDTAVAREKAIALAINAREEFRSVRKEMKAVGVRDESQCCTVIPVPFDEKNNKAYSYWVATARCAEMDMLVDVTVRALLEKKEEAFLNEFTQLSSTELSPNVFEVRNKLKALREAANNAMIPMGDDGMLKKVTELGSGGSWNRWTELLDAYMKRD